MKYLRSLCVLVGIAISTQFSAFAAAKDDGEFIAELIHSSLPLYTLEWEQIWPRSFSSNNDFGCTSRIAFGDWYFTPNPAHEAADGHWERFSNYGVFHCAAIVGISDEQADLDRAQWDHGFFVQLGTTRRELKTWELWALQKGTVPGSEYTLLARAPGEGIIENFVVLQRRCPSGKQLRVDGLGGWSTRYCAINSRAELLSLARKMLALPPLGTIQRATAAE